MTPSRVVVNSEEARILRLLDAVFRARPGAEAMTARAEPSARLTRLSATAMRLVRQRIERGMVRALAREGWRSERRPQNGRMVEGRLWERVPLENLGLRFSAWTLDWLTAAAAGADPAAEGRSPKTLGDRLLAALAWPVLRTLPTRDRYLLREPWRSDGLLRLMFPESRELTGIGGSLDFGPWLAPSAVWILEALQQRLAGAWSAAALTADADESPAAEQPAGSDLRDWVEAFLSALDAAGRQDLGGWLVVAAETLVTAQRSIGTVSGMRRDAIAALRAGLSTLETWERAARRVGYIDEGYAVAQCFLSEWERRNAGEVAARFLAE